jgi:hypothetical protein
MANRRLERIEPEINSADWAMSGKLRAGDTVVLVGVPPGLLDGLRAEDQRAIIAVVGKPVQFVGYDEDGKAELEFDDPFDPRTEHYSNTHTIWVAPTFIERYRG